MASGHSSDQRDLKNQWDQRDHWDERDQRDLKDQKDQRDHTDQRDLKDQRDQREQIEIPLSGSCLRAFRRSYPALVDLLLSRFHCNAVLLGSDLDLDPDPARSPPRPHVPPEKVCEVRLQCGVQLSVWKGDLANFSAAAVVNAANSRLQHFGGLARALSEAGGPEVQTLSNRHLRTHKELKTGDAVALGAGRLRCRVLIHAVGPQLPYKPNHHQVSTAKSLLEKTIRSVLQIVERDRLETVAIPAISSGIFNYPVAECAEVIVSSVKKFYGSSSKSFKPKEVLLVNIDEPTVKEMERACLKSFGASRDQSKGQSRDQSKGQSRDQSKDQSKCQTRGAKAENRGPKETAPPQIYFGAVLVLLRKGRLEEQKVDVLVNTIGLDRKLNMGLVSGALLKKAGHSLQSEVYSTPYGSSVVITGGHKLDCKQVYHVCCPNRHTSGSDQIMFRSVQDCLRWAVSYKHHSVAFPAIGTGNLGFSDQEAARIMLYAVRDFSQLQQPIQVHFIIFPSDTERFKVFEKELNSFHTDPALPETHQPVEDREWSSRPSSSGTSSPGPSSSGPSSSGPSSSGPSSSGPCLLLQSWCPQNLAEAETWIMCLLHNSHDTIFINNNFIQYFTERDLEDLSQLEVDVVLEEFLDCGRSGFVVRSENSDDLIVTALSLEHKIQEVTRAYVKEAGLWGRGHRRSVSIANPQIRLVHQQLKSHGFEVVKAEQVENSFLEEQYHVLKDQMSSRPPQTLLQLVSAQFCDVIADVGFRPECAPPDDPFLGLGLYFTSDVSGALNLWTDRRDRFLYLCVGEVLTGRSGTGRSGLVLGTSLDSVEDSGVSVVFSPLQALPRFILTCCDVTETSV